ncbi:MAG: hypothetical protein JO116_04710 [Planctomycetaceae bacterium]|nr:hypothetical protein [Planctomycetaceae bacterium]MBV8608246.1 hypothetical protein [Singulisphaera sp.]
MSMRAEEDRWSVHGRSHLSPSRMEAIGECLERSPIIVEHWFYRMGRAPERRIFDDFEEFQEYLKERARPGDAFHVWEFAAHCRDGDTLTNGKFPDVDGCVPEEGAN